MALKNVLAVIREEALESVLASLREAGVPGVSIVEVKGYGEYINGFVPNDLDTCFRLEMFMEEAQVSVVETVIMETARTGGKGDGIVAVMPMDYMLRIRDGDRMQ